MSDLIAGLKERRQNLGLSVPQVANRAHIDPTHLAAWESGKGANIFEAAEKCASILGMKVVLVPIESTMRAIDVDWQARRINVNGTLVRLTPMEWKVLECLAAGAGTLVSHKTLWRHIHQNDEPYDAKSTKIKVIITRLRRLLPPIEIKAQWGRGYVTSVIEPSPLAQSFSEQTQPVAPPLTRTTPLRRSPTGFKPIELRRQPAAHPPRRANSADERSSIERFLAERGVTRCPDLATIQHAPLPTLVWDKMKRKWVRPPTSA